MESRLLYDNDNHHPYVEEFYHSQLTIFVGINKEHARRMLYSWLHFFEDAELYARADEELEILFSQVKQLPPVVVMGDDDKSVN
jgi:hypothetical protein